MQFESLKVFCDVARYRSFSQAAAANHVSQSAASQIVLQLERRMGVQLVGKFAAVSGTRAQFSGSLRNKCDLADLKLGRLLDTIDEWALASGLDDTVPPPHRFAPTNVPEPPRLDLDLARGEIRTILWATGFRPDYSWLDVDVLDAKSMVRHDGGVVVDAPGMYVLGMPFLRRRKSSFIDGACDDAQDLAPHLAAFLDGRAQHS